MDFGDLMLLLQSQYNIPLKKGETPATRMIRTIDATLTNKELARALSFIISTVTLDPTMIVTNELTRPLLLAFSVVVENRLDSEFNLDNFLKKYGEIRDDDN